MSKKMKLSKIGVPNSRNKIQPQVSLISDCSEVFMKRPSPNVGEGQASTNEWLRRKLLEKRGLKGYHRGAVRNWEHLGRAATEAGIQVHEVTYQGGDISPDDTYLQDTSIVLVNKCGQKQCVTGSALGHPSRSRDAEPLLQIIGKTLPIHRLSSPMEFGDCISIHTRMANGELRKVLMIGYRDNDRYSRLLGSDQTLRTSPEAIKELKIYAENCGYRVILPHFWGGLHLTSVTTLAGQVSSETPITFLRNSGLSDETSLIKDLSDALEIHRDMINFLNTEVSSGSFETRELSRWSCSCLSNGGNVVVQRNAPITGRLQKRGFQCFATTWKYYRATEGGITCATLALGAEAIWYTVL